jgi:hypothetical protein
MPLPCTKHPRNSWGLRNVALGEVGRRGSSESRGPVGEAGRGQADGGPVSA